MVFLLLMYCRIAVGLCYLDSYLYIIIICGHEYAFDESGIRS